MAGKRKRQSCTYLRILRVNILHLFEHLFSYEESGWHLGGFGLDTVHGLVPSA